VTSDHGEEFGERGSWGHAHTLYREALEIPLIVAGPGLEPAVRDEAVGTIDIAPTIAAIAGVPFASGGDGVDLRGVIPTRTFYAETSRFNSARLSIQADGRRLDVDLAHGTRTLYDVDGDRDETKPIPDPAAADGLEARLFDHLGTPWTAGSGPVRTSGWMWTAGGRPTRSLEAPGAFGVYPPDAEVEGGGGAPIHGVREAPREGPLRYDGPRNAVGIALGSDVKAQLEALGYVQGNDP